MMGLIPVLTLTFWLCVVVRSQSSQSNQGVSNVTLVKKSQQHWCMLRGRASSSGVTWTPQQEIKSEEPVVWNTLQSQLNCNFMKGEGCSKWKTFTQHGSSIPWNPSSSDSFKPPVLDYRWNDLPMINTPAKKEIIENNWRKLPATGNWILTVSVNAKTDAYVVLCKSDTKYPTECYWIILGGWGNTRSAVRRCPKGVLDPVTVDCQKLYGAKNQTRLLGNEKWIHVTISFTTREVSEYGQWRIAHDLKVKIVGKDDEDLLDFTDKNGLQPKYLNVNSANKDSFFRIHDYVFNWNSNGDYLESEEPFVPSSSTLCVSLLYYTQSQCNLKLEIFYVSENKWELLKELKPSEKKWREGRIVQNLTDGWNNGILFRISPVNSNNWDPSFAIGGIRECNIQSDERVSYAVAKSEKTKLSCNLLKYNSTFKFERAASNFTGETPRCSTTLPELQDCAGVVTCRPGSGCFCSPGYQGADCKQTCNSKMYGKNCQEHCGHCAYNEDCNTETGVCARGCQRGFRGLLCNTSKPVLNNPPVCVMNDLTTITVKINETVSDVDDKPIHIIFQYKKNEENDWQSGTPLYYNPSTNVETQLSDLSPGTNYSIRAVIIEQGEDDYEGAGVPQTNCRTRCNHPQSEEVSVTSGKRDLTIDWQKPENPCQGNAYGLIVESVGEEGSHKSRPINYLPFSFGELTPYKLYNWRLHFIDDDQLIASGSIRTEEDIPSEVESLTVEGTDSTTLNVTWKSPKNPNGEITHYNLKYEHVTYRACVPARSNETSAGEFNTESTSTLIKDLVPYSRYNVFVKASTIIGYGPAANVNGVTKESEIPQFRPTQYNGTNIFKREAVIWWILPTDCTIIKSDNKNFNVIIIPTSPWGNETIVTINLTNNGNSTRKVYSARFENLIPYTAYNASVFAKGSNGNVNIHLPLNYNFTTKPDVPSPVLNATAYSFGRDWILLRWKAPYPPYGELDKYEVKYFHRNERDQNKEEFDAKNSSCILWERYSCVKITRNLLQDTDYEIMIRSKNMEPNIYSQDISVIATTTEKEPGSPPSLGYVYAPPTNLNLTWEHPFYPNGRIKHFLIEITETGTHLRRKVETKLDRVINVTVSQPQRNYVHQVNVLPATEYRVSIHAVTVSPGNPILKYFTVPMIPPDISSFQLNGDAEITNVTFGVVIPKADQYLTKESLYFIIVSSSETEDRELTENEFVISKNLTENIAVEADVKGNKWWIAAELQPKDEKDYFTVGSNSEHKSVSGRQYRNLPLNPGESYKTILVAVNQLNNSCAYSIGTVKQQTKSAYNPESNISGAWAAMLLLLLIPAVIFFFIWRKKQMTKEGDTLELKTQDALGGSQSESIDNITQQEVEQDEMPTETKLSPSQRFSRRVAITELEKYVKEGLTSGELQRQHALFPRGQTQPWDYGRLPQNKSKNRYGNLVAYDETRVKLKKSPEDQFSDYINANYINGYNSPKFYIATQGPKRNTIADFWKMVWQEHVQVIAMLANVVENGKLKCEQYWPQLGQEVTYGAVTIMNASNKIFADFTFRLLNVTCKGKTRKVHHLHFTSWPDHGVPLYPQSVASYLKKLLATPPGTGPIVVHCSAGVGRTGTIVLADVCLRMAAAEGHVDILSFLQQIREQRANMVDNLDQYKLVHLVLLECLVTEPSAIPCDSNLEKRIEELSKSGTLVRQFNHLHNIRWQDQALKPTALQSSIPLAENFKSKNRFQKIVPGASGRIFVSRYPYNDMNSDYINAVLVDGFRIKDQFIATQFPLPSTVADFWRMIVERSVSLVVVLNEVDLEIKNVCKFWPTEDEPQMNPMPHLAIKCKVEDDSMYWIIYKIIVFDRDTTSATEDKTLQILQLKGWRSDEMLPPSASVILELWQEAERLYNGKGPMVVTCLDGATACGYFLSLAFLVEKIKLEQECDVCLAIRTVRQNREQFIPSLEQFEFLYRAAITYLDTFQTYANFN